MFNWNRPSSVALIVMLVLAAGCSKPAKQSPSSETKPASQSQATPPGKQGETTPASQIAANPNAVRIEAAKGQGTLVLTLPAGSKPVESKNQSEGLVTARYRLPDGVFVQANLLGPADLSPGFGSDDALKSHLNDWYKLMQSSMVDGARDVVPLDGDAIHGFYMEGASDDPSPNAQNYILNGCFRVGDYVVMMGGLHSDASGKAYKEILDIIRSAKWEGAPATPAAQ